MAATAVDGEDIWSAFDQVRTAKATSPVLTCNGDRLPRRPPAADPYRTPLPVVRSGPVIAAVRYLVLGLTGV
jgi:hypothetical protein